MRTRDKVSIGWLDPGQVDGMFAMSIASVYANRLDRIDALLRVEAGGLLSRGRNELVARFITTSTAEWLLMIDSDEQLSLEAFDKLVGAMHDKDRPIVAGLYFGAWPGEFYPQAVPLIFNRVEGSTRFLPVMDYPVNKVIRIDSAGTGCLMIHRSVFEAFQAEATPHEGKTWCWFRDMPVNGDWFSEDHFFCARAIELGFPIHAHTGATLPHRKRFWLTEAHHLASREGPK
jgi:GT2 family glycosyltransferase